MDVLKARVQYNVKCLKCHFTTYKMVRIGAIIMCDKCYGEEFERTYEFDKESKRGKQYSKWLRVMERMRELEDI